MSGTADRVASIEQVQASGLFDADWYLQRNKDVARSGMDPFRHFVNHGRAEGRWPNRYFNPAWYRRENPDVAQASIDPLLHYIADGEREGRKAHPVFHPVWYRQAYEVPAERLALAHFVANRLSGQVVPCAELFAVPLIEPYRGDPTAGIDPIAHYLDDRADSGLELLLNVEMTRGSGLFDENYYLINGSDVHDANADPIQHYCQHGWREDRKPNIYFDPVWYTRTNTQVGRLGLNPLVHYMLIGEPSSRRPVPFFDPGWYRAEYQVPPWQTALGHYLTNRRKQLHSPTPLFDVKWYMERFGGELGPNRDPFAHYLQAGLTKDIDPSRWFNAAQYRRRHLGRPTRGFQKMLRPDQHHPLVHYLRSQYEQETPDS